MVFGGYLARQSVKKIIFEDAFVEVPSNAWDISRDKNGTVMAWVEKSGKLYNLHIGSKNRIIANEDCSGLFSGYVNMTSIDFSVYFDTSNVQDMSHMFEGCAKLKKLDLSSLNMSNVTSFEGVFSGCSSLTELELGQKNKDRILSKNKDAALEGSPEAVWNLFK